MYMRDETEYQDEYLILVVVTFSSRANYILARTFSTWIRVKLIHLQ